MLFLRWIKELSEWSINKLWVLLMLMTFWKSLELSRRLLRSKKSLKRLSIELSRFLKFMLWKRSLKKLFKSKRLNKLKGLYMFHSKCQSLSLTSLKKSFLLIELLKESLKYLTLLKESLKLTDKFLELFKLKNSLIELSKLKRLSKSRKSLITFNMKSDKFK